MAFKYDWTTGFMPLVGKTAFVLIIVLAIFSWLENYSIIIPILVSIAVVSLLIIGYSLIKGKNNNSKR